MSSFLYIGEILKWSFNKKIRQTSIPRNVWNFVIHFFCHSFVGKGDLIVCEFMVTTKAFSKIF